MDTPPTFSYKITDDMMTNAYTIMLKGGPNYCYHAAEIRTTHPHIIDLGLCRSDNMTILTHAVIKHKNIFCICSNLFLFLVKNFSDIVSTDIVYLSN